MKGPYDEQLKWPMKGHYEVKLLNQNSDSMHHSVTCSVSFSYKPTCKGTLYEAWYSNLFISHRDLTTATNGFLKDNNIYFKVCIP